MNLADLNLWEAEEQRIHQCLQASLSELINNHSVKSDNNERTVCGLLRPLLTNHTKKMKLGWTFHSESKIFKNETDPEPYARTDFLFRSSIGFNDS